MWLVFAFPFSISLHCTIDESYTFPHKSSTLWRVSL